MDISFSILVHNEGNVLEKLLNQIVTAVSSRYTYEIIIIDDFSTDTITKEILERYRSLDNIQIFQRRLNKDFASQKNFANSKCSGDYIVNVDADEYFQTDLIENLHGVMEGNTGVDMIWVPRINIVNGLRQEHITKWGWKVNEKGWVNFPDYQARIYRNAPDIKWKNKVHEFITGAQVIGRLPAEEEWCMMHIKSIDKQVSQNEFVGNMLTPQVWQYYNAMRGGFRKNVADHHKRGWENMSQEYYESLEEMSDEEIAQFLKENPVGFENGIVKHGYHRACAMIGRLADGKKYIPFYMKRENVYDTPFKDGITRIFNPILHVDRLKEIDQLGIPRSEYTICQSGILALMGIRPNDDLDIIITDRLREAFKRGPEGFKIGRGIEVFPKDYDKFKQNGCKTDEEAISDFSGNAFGYNFLEPRFYFSRKHIDNTPRDVSDWEAIHEFFRLESHKGYPFNTFNDEQWGANASKNKG